MTNVQRARMLTRQAWPNVSHVHPARSVPIQFDPRYLVLPIDCPVKPSVTPNRSLVDKRHPSSDHFFLATRLFLFDLRGNKTSSFSLSLSLDSEGLVRVEEQISIDLLFLDKERERRVVRLMGQWMRDGDIQTMKSRLSREMSHLTLVLVQLFFHSKFGIGENGSFSFDHREKIVHAEEQTSSTIDLLNAERERGERRRRIQRRLTCS